MKNATAAVYWPGDHRAARSPGKQADLRGAVNHIQVVLNRFEALKAATSRGRFSR